MGTKEFKINKENSKLRLDVFLENELKEFTRSYIKKQIENGDVLVNGKSVKAGYSLKENDLVLVKINPPKQLDLTPKKLNFEIVYQDEYLAVINKPQGLVVHPAPGNYDNTLVNGLLHEIKDLSGINGVSRPGIVHRLDKDTSGLMLVAKNDFAHVDLSKQIKDKECKRYYLALVQGNIKQDSGHVETYISRDKKNRLKMAVNFEKVGKDAYTIYKVIKRFKGYDLVECELKTGRTHQIRVHMAHLNTPVVGDKLYNTKKQEFKLNGQLLHAYKISFTHPKTKQIMTFEAEIPNYFKEVIEKLDKLN